MQINRIEVLSADECATILAQNGLLTNEVGPHPGFHFRELLRHGRDGKCKKMDGVYQKRPHTKWIIKRINI